MGSRYHAQFEVRDHTRWLVVLLLLNAFVVGSVSFLGGVPLWLRLLAGAAGLGLLVLSWGIHRALEWARITGVLVCGGFALVGLLGRDDSKFFVCLLGACSAVWLALPSTKALFGFARERIRRTEASRLEERQRRVGEP